MFVERLTEHDIEKFKNLTPLTVEGKIIPYRICCNDVFYNNIKDNNTPYIIFLKDYDCSLPFADKSVKHILRSHYRQFMINLFGDEYKNALSLHIFKNNNTEKTLEEEQTL